MNRFLKYACLTYLIITKTKAFFCSFRNEFVPYLYLANCNILYINTFNFLHREVIYFTLISTKTGKWSDGNLCLKASSIWACLSVSTLVLSTKQ